MTNMKGTCLCGTVSFQLTGNTPNLYQCHCSLCRQQTGTASNAATIVPAEQFQWLQGESEITRWKKDTGFSSHFCRHCGCPVPNPLLDRYQWIPAGLLKDLNAKVVAHLHCDSQAQWDEIPEGATNYPGMPEDLDAFVQSLQSP